MFVFGNLATLAWKLCHVELFPSVFIVLFTGAPERAASNSLGVNI
jgi:hypothetical protein